MSAKRRMAPESRERRALLKGGLALAASCVLPGAWTPAHAVSERTERLLKTSEFVYVSPLLRDGRESTCHGEVWYGWDEGSVALITARTTWKGRAYSRGLHQARVWVGDHGRWKGFFSNNEDFRKAPTFDTRVHEDNDPKLLERLMKTYAAKYPAEFSDWEGPMRTGFASGERVILRYTPL